MTELEWVEILKVEIEAALSQRQIIVETGFRLPYAFYISSYDGASFDTPKTIRHKYQKDLLVAERVRKSKDWVPRVVIECKLRTVTTHDALTYSAKAATHKNVHPYLRYGIIVGHHPGPVQRLLLRHGHQFDFMQMLEREKTGAADRERLSKLLRDEVRASQNIQRILSGDSDATLVHRKLVTAR